MLKNFSLPAAVVLGCCSFEAYNAPYKSYGLKEVSPCGTEVIYMDADFLSRQISGVLEVSEPCCHSKRGRTPTQSQVYNVLKVLLGVLTYIQDVQSCQTLARMPAQRSFTSGALEKSDRAATDCGQAGQEADAKWALSCHRLSKHRSKLKYQHALHSCHAK